MGTTSKQEKVTYTADFSYIKISSYQGCALPPLTLDGFFQKFEIQNFVSQKISNVSWLISYGDLNINLNA